MSRRAILLRVAELAGSGFTTLHAGDGWPGEVRLERVGRFFAYVAPVTLSHRGRDNRERRFQNPGSNRPITLNSGAEPLLLALWEERRNPVLVVGDARIRAGLNTRYSIFVALDLLLEAEELGWAERTSASGEQFTAFHPALLPSFLESRRAGVDLQATELVGVIGASGLPFSREQEAAERARRAATVVVRASAFRRDVLTAYGDACAMCGLGAGLTQGAHIFPASAPGATDEVTNGLALCANHHVAFDRHLIWVDPEDRDLRVSPSLNERANEDPAVARFVEGTESRLRDPLTEGARPESSAFESRYRYFEGRYGWIV